MSEQEDKTVRDRIKARSELIVEYDADDSDSDVPSSYLNRNNWRSVRTANTGKIRKSSTPERQCKHRYEKELRNFTAIHRIETPKSAIEVVDETEEELSLLRERIEELKVISEAKEKEFVVLSFEIARNEEKTLKYLDVCKERADKRQSWQKKVDQIKHALKRLNENLDSMNKSLVEKEIYHCISLDLSNHELKKISELKEVVEARVASLEETAKTLQRWTEETEKLKEIAKDCCECYENKDSKDLSKVSKD